MSYTISIGGHAETDGAEHSRQFELEQLSVARATVAKLQGATSASFSGGHIGFVDLLKPADETQPPTVVAAPAAEAPEIEPPTEPAAEVGSAETPPTADTEA